MHEIGGVCVAHTSSFHAISHSSNFLRFSFGMRPQPATYVTSSLHHIWQSSSMHSMPPCGCALLAPIIRSGQNLLIYNPTPPRHHAMQCMLFAILAHREHRSLLYTHGICDIRRPTLLSSRRYLSYYTSDLSFFITIRRAIRSIFTILAFRDFAISKIPAASFLVTMIDRAAEDAID